MNSSEENPAFPTPKTVTSRRRRTLLSGLALLPLAPRLGNASTSAIEVDSTQRFQVVEGFGTSINTWQEEVAAAYRHDDWASFYLEALGASALRIELWGGVAPVAREQWQDVSLRDFRLDGTGQRGRTTSEITRRLYAASKSRLRVIASAWSPPAWMKVNGALGNGHPKKQNFALNFDDRVERGPWNLPQENEQGNERYSYIARNKLRRDRYLHFAKLLVEWARYYRSLGIPLYALSPANEPRFSHWFESCVYTPEEYAELVETLAWMFASQGEPPIRIFGPEHMTWDVAGNQHYLDALMKRRGSMQSIAAFASHGYVDGYAADTRRDSTSTFRKLVAPTGKAIWVTEGGFGGHEWPDPLHQLAASFLYALRDGGVSLLTTWQTLTRHPPDTHGLMSIRGPTKKTYVAMQFWRFIRPGMVRIGTRANTGLDAVAFEDSDSGTTVVIVLNRTRANSRFSLRFAGKRHVAVESLFLTDRTNDCARVSGPHDQDSISIPPEAVATIVSRTRGRAGQ